MQVARKCETLSKLDTDNEDTKERKKTQQNNCMELKLQQNNETIRNRQHCKI